MLKCVLVTKLRFDFKSLRGISESLSNAEFY